ncbi:MAG TPA: large-conductance mechanosensitive channel protein MscL [Candidatus Wallbacteria bacterium]|nr:MAG: Large-conductance mechanosensitive channel [bacterium ADurb.Bin243]HOD43060.1 large-conductance mechanosensitive channel protein MscL [Candidatus Wallbacteria bacterium]HPG57298.1 large-conductance mechanosensitive channel protein MscL [Candidatus Wallbacteria bacterium]
MGFISEFRDFAVKGNVMDMAVGVIIGGAFGKIVASVVADVIMPPIGLLTGGVNFTDIKISLKDAVIDQSGKILAQPVTINIGNFLQTMVDFTIVAFAIFLLIKALNALKRRVVAETPAPPAEPPRQEVLLSEIRDLLKQK